MVLSLLCWECAVCYVQMCLGVFFFFFLKVAVVFLVGLKGRVDDGEKLSCWVPFFEASWTMRDLLVVLYLALGIGAFLLWCALCFHFCFENPQTRVSDCYDALNNTIKGVSVNNSRGAGGNDPVACV